MSDIMKIIDNDEFIFFLIWLAEEQDWNAREIISVVEKPYSYQNTFDKYKKEGE
jgi:hypothetical protein